MGLGQPRRLLGPLPPRLVARPLPGRDGADGGGRPRRRRARGRLPVGPPAAARRLLPAELQPRRLTALAEPAARRGRLPDRAVVAARPLRRPHLEPRAARRGLHRDARPRLAGALGERRRLLAGDDRGVDRRVRDRGRDRRPQRGARRRRPLPPPGRQVAGERRHVDAHDQRTALPAPLLPAAHEGRPRERRDDVHDRRRRPDGRPAQRRRPELPRARPLRRQARGRRRHPLDDPRRRPRAGRHDAERASSGTATTTTVTARRPTAVRSRGPATRGGCGRSSLASAASTSWPATARAHAAPPARGCARSPRQATTASCCPSRSGTRTRRPAGRASRVARARSPRRRSPGRTRSSSALPDSTDAGRPVERPHVVACRYAGECRR